jgi:hypothetical protein
VIALSADGESLPVSGIPGEPVFPVRAWTGWEELSCGALFQNSDASSDERKEQKEKRSEPPPDAEHGWRYNAIATPAPINEAARIPGPTLERGNQTVVQTPS